MAPTAAPRPTRPAMFGVPASKRCGGSLNTVPSKLTSLIMRTGAAMKAEESAKNKETESDKLRRENERLASEPRAREMPSFGRKHGRKSRTPRMDDQS